jgi:excisionase family DNA binding protein
MSANYLNPKRSAEYAGLSVTGLYRAMQANALRSYKVNGRRLIKIADLEAFVEAQPSDVRAAA